MTMLKPNPMKKLVPSILLLFAFMWTAAQVPQGINYQGVARNSVGSVIANKDITLRLSIRSNTANGTVVYSETRSLKTNAVGLFSTAIGSSGATSVGSSWTLNI